MPLNGTVESRVYSHVLAGGGGNSHKSGCCLSKVCGHKPFLNTSYFLLSARIVRPVDETLHTCIIMDV